MSMKNTILNNTDSYFTIEDAYRIMSQHTQHSVRGRLNEMVASGQLIRARAGSGHKTAIYAKPANVVAV